MLTSSGMSDSYGQGEWAGQSLLSRALEALHQPQAQLAGPAGIDDVAGRDSTTESDIWVWGGGVGVRRVTDGWKEAQALVPARSIDACTLGSAPGALGLARGSLLGCSPYSAKQAQSSLGMSDSGIGEGLASALSRESLSSGTGGGEPAGAGPFPWEQEGLLGLWPRPPWATSQAAGLEM